MLDQALQFTRFVRRFLPFWLRSYERADLRGDLVAGLTTAVMLVPQGMAYALLAGLPPIVGLYAATLPLVIYAFVGSSREVSIGPAAIDSMLTGAGVGALAVAGSARYGQLAILLAALVAGAYLTMALLRVGHLATRIPHSVITGFTSAAALIIAASQLGPLLGLHIARGPLFHTIAAAGRALPDIDPTTAIIGLGSIALLVTLRRWRPMFPRALAVVVLSSLAVWLTGADVAIVGAVPGGLPALTLPSGSMSDILELLPVAITIAAIGFMEATSVARAFARRRGYEIRPNTELWGLGLANAGAALVGGFPVTGGLARTAVNAQAGARSGLAALVTAAAVALTLLFLTPLFFFLPRAVLAGIITSAVVGLVDLGEMRHLYRHDRPQLLVLAVTFAAIVVAGIAEGLIVGLAAAVAVALAARLRSVHAGEAIIRR